MKFFLYFFSTLFLFHSWMCVFMFPCWAEWERFVRFKVCFRMKRKMCAPLERCSKWQSGVHQRICGSLLLKRITRWFGRPQRRIWTFLLANGKNAYGQFIVIFTGYILTCWNILKKKNSKKNGGFEPLHETGFESTCIYKWCWNEELALKVNCSPCYIKPYQYMNITLK